MAIWIRPDLPTSVKWNCNNRVAGHQVELNSGEPACYPWSLSVEARFHFIRLPEPTFDLLHLAAVQLAIETTSCHQPPDVDRRLLTLLLQYAWKVTAP